MSIFAGVFVRQGDHAVPGEFIEELRAGLSRYPGDEIIRTEFTDERVFIAKVEIGALGDPGDYSQPELMAFVAGDPILHLDSAGPPMSRAEGLRSLAHDLVAGRQDALRACRGTYCAAIYERSSQILHLVSDKVGVRPVYCWVSPQYVVFASALRILEALSFCKKSINILGIAEAACFGYPLSDRTPYENIFTLLAGEVVSIGTTDLRRRIYWRWDALPAATASSVPSPQRLYELFRKAVEVRLGRQKSAAAFLSGGLDSRAIAAALKALGVDVFTANFAPAGSQDQVFGQLAAQRLGTRHSHLDKKPLTEGDPYSTATVNDWLSLMEREHLIERPRVVWSGDGGSVCLGHVYLNSRIVAATRANDLSEATKEFLAYNRLGVDARLLKHQVRTEIGNKVKESIRAELESVHPVDPGRVFYLFLLLNDQRRHMFNHFENLDLARIELEMPFFDADFLEGVLREPIDPFLRHVFYLDWLEFFPPGVLESPWQAYPRHLPCPHPLPEGLTYQWDEFSPEEVAERRNTALSKAHIMLREPIFSQQFLSQGRMRLFMLLMRYGKADRSYLLQLPSVVHRYWSRTTASSLCA